MLSLYTDGSCIDNKNGLYCGWAFAVVRAGELLYEHAAGHLEGSNNVGELSGAIEALEHMLVHHEQYFRKGEETKIEIVSDSQYVVKGMNEWIRKWKSNGWVSHGGEAVKNEKLWRKLDRLRLDLENIGYEVSFRHVKGHRGDTFNEHVDKLAGEAARKYKPTDGATSKL